MRKLKMATEYTLAAAKAAFLGILMSCLAMAPVAAPAALAVVAGSGCNAAQVQADIRTVLNDLPTAINIAEAIATIISGAGVSNTNTVTEITNWGGQIAEDLKLSQSLLTQYQSGLASAPAGIISEFDTAIATINSNLTAILNATHVYDLTTQRAVSVWITGIDGVLLGLESQQHAIDARNPDRDGALRCQVIDVRGVQDCGEVRIDRGDCSVEFADDSGGGTRQPGLILRKQRLRKLQILGDLPAPIRYFGDGVGIAHAGAADDGGDRFGDVNGRGQIIEHRSYVGLNLRGVASAAGNDGQGCGSRYRSHRQARHQDPEKRCLRSSQRVFSRHFQLSHRSSA